MSVEATTKYAPGENPTLYEQLLRGGLKFRNRKNRASRMQEYARIVGHDYFGNKADVDRPVVNLMAARTRSIPPQLAFNEPTFDVKCIGVMPTPNSEVASAVELVSAES